MKLVKIRRGAGLIDRYVDNFANLETGAINYLFCVCQSCLRPIQEAFWRA